MSESDIKQIATKYVDPVLLRAALKLEMEWLFAAHARVGLQGAMCIYSPDTQDPWVPEIPGIRFWFGPDQTEEAANFIIEFYRGGARPNTTLLLNPIIHRSEPDGRYTPLGSGFVWSTTLVKGADYMTKEAVKRIREQTVPFGFFIRGENDQAGCKTIFVVDKALPMTPEGAVLGNRAIGDLLDLDCEEYFPFYMLSGLSYLTKNGSYIHEDFGAIVGLSNGLSIEESIDMCRRDLQPVLDAAECWNAYERQQKLYDKFGQNTKMIAQNLEFYRLCAQDLFLFDRTGPMREDLDVTFDFLVKGLIPKGAIVVLAAAGGVGKSSIAHELCVRMAIDYREDEHPMWLGRPLNIEHCHGIPVYFSGEDGPAIINARGALFDPENRASRLMFHRTDFGGEDVTFAEFLRKRLYKMPDVPVMVVDPARKYLSGDEEDSDIVSQFFEAIEEFALEKGTTVVVVHHLQKGASPRSVREVLDELRGSQVFIDRPRVVVGMYRDGPYTCVGLAKCNVPPSLGMITDEMVFVRDPQLLQLVQMPGERGWRRNDVSPEELAAIRAEADEFHRAAELQRKITAGEIKKEAVVGVEEAKLEQEKKKKKT
jgi:hypothetical protein